MVYRDVIGTISRAIPLQLWATFFLGVSSPLLLASSSNIVRKVGEYERAHIWLSQVHKLFCRVFNRPDKVTKVNVYPFADDCKHNNHFIRFQTAQMLPI